LDSAPIAAGTDWDVRVFTAVRPFVAVVAAGVMLAALPVILLDRALDSQAAREAQERLAAQAQGALALTEARLGQAADTLIELAEAGVNGCAPEALEAMRLAVFTSTPLKGLTLLDERGQVLCSHAGMIAEPHAASREHLLADDRLTLSVSRFRDRNERAARLRLAQANGRSLAVFIAADALLPASGGDADTAAGRVRLILEDGEMIASHGGNGDDTAPAGAGKLLAAQASSARFPVAVVAERSGFAPAQAYRLQQFLARAAVVLFVAFGAGLIWFGVRRNRNDPVLALQQAIRNGEIVPFFQPTVDTRNGRVLGAEVLARWRRPDGALVSPAHFIPLAEQSGLIYDLTRALMQRARDEVGATFLDRPRLRLAFNLFAGHFADFRIVADIRHIFDGSAVPMSQLVVEVTERAPLADLGAARQVIERLQSLGVKVAIDDVGTGHGGLSYLLKLGVDIIKIDKMFVDAIGNERYSHTIIETLVELARSMNMNVIGEGVETVEQIEYLRLKGVYEAQGFVFAPPLPASSFLALVEAMDRPRSGIVAEPEQLAAALGSAA
jgi:sensor c-di-GMP phosphodiesterase-like protein